MPSGRTNNFPESWRGLGHVTTTIFGSTVGYPSDSLASCSRLFVFCHCQYSNIVVNCSTCMILRISALLPVNTKTPRDHLGKGNYRNSELKINALGARTNFTRTAQLKKKKKKFI